LTTFKNFVILRQTIAEGEVMKNKDVLDLVYLGIFCGCIIIGFTLIGAING
jgi:hypothetical protein